MNIFSRIKAIIRLNEAIRMANDEFIKQGTRFYVMPYNTDDYKPKLLVMDRNRFRQFKQKGYIPRQATVADLEREAFYFTPYANGTCALPPEARSSRREIYLRWINSLRNSRRLQKRMKKERRKQIKK